MGTFLSNKMVDQGILSDAERKFIIKSAGNTPGGFAKNVLSLGILDEVAYENFVKAHAKSDIDAEAVSAMRYSESTCPLDPSIIKMLEIIPLRWDSQSFVYGSYDPYDPQINQQIAFFTGLQASGKFIRLSDIRTWLTGRFPDYKAQHSDLEDILAKHDIGTQKGKGQKGSDSFLDLSNDELFFATHKEDLSFESDQSEEFDSFFMEAEDFVPSDMADSDNGSASSLNEFHSESSRDHSLEEASSLQIHPESFDGESSDSDVSLDIGSLESDTLQEEEADMLDSQPGLEDSVSDEMRAIDFNDLSNDVPDLQAARLQDTSLEMESSEGVAEAPDLGLGTDLDSELSALEDDMSDDEAALAEPDISDDPLADTLESFTSGESADSLSETTMESNGSIADSLDPSDILGDVMPDTDSSADAGLDILGDVSGSNSSEGDAESSADSATDILSDMGDAVGSESTEESGELANNFVPKLEKVLDKKYTDGEQDPEEDTPLEDLTLDVSAEQAEEDQDDLLDAAVLSDSHEEDTKIDTHDIASEESSAPSLDNEKSQNTDPAESEQNQQQFNADMGKLNWVNSQIAFCSDFALIAKIVSSGLQNSGISVGLIGVIEESSKVEVVKGWHQGNSPEFAAMQEIMESSQEDKVSILDEIARKKLTEDGVFKEVQEKDVVLLYFDQSLSTQMFFLGVASAQWASHSSFLNALRSVLKKMAKHLVPNEKAS